MRPILTSSVLACALLLAGSTAAQEVADGPLPTAGSSAGGVPTDAASAEIARTPAPAKAQPQPLTDDLMAAADAGRHAPLLGEYHGQVGAMVGTGGLRGAYGHLNAHPNDHVTLDLRFSTLHAKGYPYGGVYGYGPGLYADPLYGRPYRPGTDGWATEVLGPDETPPPAGAQSDH